MPLEHFPIACGSPVSLKGHRSHADVLQGLIVRRLARSSETAARKKAADEAHPDSASGISAAGPNFRHFASKRCGIAGIHR